MNEEKDSTSPNVGPGDRIAGYRLEEQIGEGGMAVVFRAHDDRLDRQVALKLLTPALAADVAFRARFIRESHLAALVEHPNVIPVYDAGEVDGLLFISMRFVHGGDVRALCAGGHAMPPNRVADITGQVAQALDAAHAHGLIHRDVKPANMLLDQPAGRTGSGQGRADRVGHVYLSDFGISRPAVASRLTSTGQFVGTLDYIAPEQIEAQVIDGRADQYSLACAAYEMLTGEPPFHGDHSLALISAHLTSPPPPLTDRRPDLPAAADSVLAKAMAKAPVQRYPSCGDFADELGRALVAGAAAPTVSPFQPRPAPPTRPAAPQPPQLAPPPVAPPRPAASQPGLARPGRGRPAMVAAAAGGIAAVLVVAGALAYVFEHRGPAPAPSAAPPVASGAPTSSPVIASAQARQVKAVNMVLTASAATLTNLQELADNVAACGNLGSDIAQLKQVADQRSQELADARELNVDAIAGGGTLKSQLVQALSVSLRSDQSYVSWAEQQKADGCAEGTTSRYFKDALATDRRSTNNKDTFRHNWNPIATKYGYPTNPDF